MLFYSPLFFIFFAVTCTAYWTVRGNTARKALLTIASYVFYAAWDWRFLSLILFSTLLDYMVGLRLEASSAPPARRRYLFVSLMGNLGVLGFFKYFNFFVGEFTALSARLGTPIEDAALNIILPVGISFYTFQTLSYTIDVYRGRLTARRNFLDIALFVAFFPQLVAGPIVRAAQFLPQLVSARSATGIPWRSCVLLFLFGLIKKIVVADNLAPIVEPVFANPSLYHWTAVYIAVIAFAVQIYCDFSGYSDMAIACAMAFGYRLPINFAWPYFAGNISDFWRRWHISLSSWLRDYLYISLGGNRRGKLLRYRNLALTMVLGGLWHGAAWTFVIWGLLHGVALGLFHLGSELWSRRSARLDLPGWLARSLQLLSVGVTFWFVCLCWLFFRAPNLEAALDLTRTYLGRASGSLEPYGITVLLVLLALAILHFMALRLQPVALGERLGPWSYGALVGALVAFNLLFMARETAPFIYFQF